MNRATAVLVPNAITALRLMAGPIYLGWGPLPTDIYTLLLLLLTAATDLVDGRIARALGSTTSVGAVLDTAADKVLVASLLLAVTLRGGMNGWLFALIILQYVAIAIVGARYVREHSRPPVPTTAARLAACVAVTASLMGVAFMDEGLTDALSVALVCANFAHLYSAVRR